MGMWADNGDYVSMHYAGTCSSTSDMIKTGKNGLMQKINQGMIGVQRMYNQNFMDDQKQVTINLLLGINPLKVGPPLIGQGQQLGDAGQTKNKQLVIQSDPPIE